MSTDTEDEMMDMNEQLILIGGESGTGKSASLRNLKNPEGVMYLNCEAGKRLPFKNKFQTYKIEDPYQVLEAFDFAKDNPDIHTIVIDSITFLMDMFESLYIVNAGNKMDGWAQYQQFFKTLMQQKVTSSDKAVIMIAHTRTDIDDNQNSFTAVPVKGALKNNGIEAYFSTVVAAKKVPIKELEKYGSDLLEITEHDRLLGYKYVFQTQITARTTGERIRGPMGLFTVSQTYMENDAQLLLTHLNKYYE